MRDKDVGAMISLQTRVAFIQRLCGLVSFYSKPWGPQMCYTACPRTLVCLWRRACTTRLCCTNDSSACSASTADQCKQETLLWSSPGQENTGHSKKSHLLSLIGWLIHWVPRLPCRLASRSMTLKLPHGSEAEHRTCHYWEKLT